MKKETKTAFSNAFRSASQGATKPEGRLTVRPAKKTQDLQKRIEEKAYELFERRGYSHGNDLADWFEAERIIKSQDN